MVICCKWREIDHNQGIVQTCVLKESKKNELVNETLAEAINDTRDRAVWQGPTLLVSHLILTFTGKYSDETVYYYRSGENLPFSVCH